MDSIWSWCRQSATILWARICVLAGAVVVAIGYFAGLASDAFNMPGVKDALAAIGMQPKVLTSIGAIIMLMNAVTELARRRTIRKE